MIGADIGCKKLNAHELVRQLWANSQRRFYWCASRALAVAQSRSGDRKSEIGGPVHTNQTRRGPVLSNSFTTIMVNSAKFRR